MKKTILPVAVATLTLVLSAGGGFAEPPKPTGPSNASGIDNDQFQRLPDAEMAAVTGSAWWSGGCTGVIRGAGFLLWLHGLAGNPVQQGVGLYMQQVECA